MHYYHNQKIKKKLERKQEIRNLEERNSKSPKLVEVLLCLVLCIVRQPPKLVFIEG